MAIFYLTNLTGIFEPPGTETEKKETETGKIRQRKRNRNETMYSKEGLR